MATKKTTTIKKSMFKWQEAYTDLPTNVAEILREKRLKPEQIAKMADGELMALDGIKDEAVAQIREKYPVDLISEKFELLGGGRAKQSEAPDSREVVAPSSHSPRLKYPRVLHGRSKKYNLKKLRVADKVYPLDDAIKLLRKVSYSKLKTIELHLNTKDATVRGELSLPHSIGKDIKVAIFSDELAAQIKDGKINFDILLARPADMGKIAPLARVLGPKGLMPNPKTGTIIDDPEARAKTLTAGATLAYKTEPKAKVIHLNAGNLNQKDTEILDNLNAILTGIGVTKLTTAYLKSTMSPSIRLDISTL